MDADNEQPQKDCPRTYQTDASARRFTQGVGIFLVILCLGMTPIHLLGLMKHPLPPFQLAVMDVGAIAFAVWISSMANRRVILHENAIEVAGWFSSRKLNRSEILGRRMGRVPKRAGGSSYYIIVPGDTGKPALKLPPLLQVDKYFHAWIKTIPDITK